MIDIDLGPAIRYIFVVLIVIPVLVGFLIGIVVGYLLIQKRSVSKIKKIATILTVGIFLAALFPVIAIKFNRWQTDYENAKLNKKEEWYIEKNLSSFRIEKVSFSQNSYQILLSVPRTGKYSMKVELFRNKTQTTLLSGWVDGVDLMEGVNTLNLDVQNDGTALLPADLVITIQNTDDSFALRNIKKSLFVSNAGAIEKQEGVIYYSPGIATDNGKCPVFNYLSWLPCVPNNLLHVE